MRSDRGQICEMEGSEIKDEQGMCRVGPRVRGSGGERETHTDRGRECSCKTLLLDRLKQIEEDNSDDRILKKNHRIE